MGTICENSMVSDRVAREGLYKETVCHKSIQVK